MLFMQRFLYESTQGERLQYIIAQLLSHDVALYSLGDAVMTVVVAVWG